MARYRTSRTLDRMADARRGAPSQTWCPVGRRSYCRTMRGGDRPVHAGFRAAYRALEARMRTLAEADGDVFLPNPEPSPPVEYVFICMEPSIGRWGFIPWTRRGGRSTTGSATSSPRWRISFCNSPFESTYARRGSGITSRTCRRGRCSSSGLCEIRAVRPVVPVAP